MALLSLPTSTASSSSLQIPRITGNPSPRMCAAITTSDRFLSADVRFNAHAIRGLVRPGKLVFMRLTKAGRVSGSDSGSSDDEEEDEEGGEGEREREGVGDASDGIMRKLGIGVGLKAARVAVLGGERVFRGG